MKKENFYYCSYVHKGFIFAVSLLNNSMKILVGLGIFSHVILKTLGLIVCAKTVFFNKQINICWFEYELRDFNDFTLRNMAISHYHIYRKQMKKNFSFKKRGISVQQKW